MPKKKKGEVAEATSTELVESEITDPKEDEAASAEPSPLVRKHARLDKMLANELMTKIQKKHGSGILLRASEHSASHVDFISTGIFELDRALGGGYRVGGIHTIWGPKSSGKTTTLLKTIGTAQKQCANCWRFAQFSDPKSGEVLEKPVCECGKYREVIVGYINTEGPANWDPKWVTALGVDTGAMLLNQPESAEQALDIGEALLRSGDLDILVIDSIAFLTPEKEIEESAAKETMGVQSRKLGTGVRKFVSALAYSSNRLGRVPTIFFTNQVRFKLGVLFGNPETQPGGQAPQFAATTEVKFRNAKVATESEKADGADGRQQTKPEDLHNINPLTVDFQFRVEKNKQNSPMREGFYTLMLASAEDKKKGDVVDEAVIMEQAERYGLIEKSGGTWLCAGQPFDNKKAIEKALTESPEFRRALAQGVLKVLLESD
jgi:recombination protein RecA